MTLKGFWTLRKMFCSNNEQTESILFIKHIATSVGITTKICNVWGAWNSAKLCLLPVTEGNWIFCFRIIHIIYEVDITFFFCFSPKIFVYDNLNAQWLDWLNMTPTLNTWLNWDSLYTSSTIPMPSMRTLWVGLGHWLLYTLCIQLLPGSFKDGSL